MMPSGSADAFDLNNFALDNIERIEILKGAQSTLYGSDAVAGVINIISKKVKVKSHLNLNVDFSAGSYETYKGGISLSGTNGKGQTYFISYNKITAKVFLQHMIQPENKVLTKMVLTRMCPVELRLPTVEKYIGALFGKYNNNHADIDAGAFQG